MGRFGRAKRTFGYRPELELNEDDPAVTEVVSQSERHLPLGKRVRES